MFATWGRMLAAHGRVVSLISIVTMVAAVLALLTVAPDLSPDGFISEEAESAQVDRTLAETFGSVFLPLKPIFMTLLSISAALGAVVFIFQDGNLETLFGFQASGEIISTTPILMFCILFGLSMDYEVLMLSRIQEEYLRTGDNRALVAFGLEKTGKVITGAAAIMVVVFGGFILADIPIIKSMGFGLAFAVLIDATIVRGLLVPATMR